MATFNTHWPLLHGNADDLSQAADPRTKARLLADRIGLLARHGFKAQAVALLTEAREAVLDIDDGEAFVRLAISEAIVAYYGPNASHSRETFDTALSAAQAHGLPELAAEAAVWTASHRRTYTGGTDEVADLLRYALEHAGPSCPTTLPRALYGAGSAFMMAGLSTNARLCYRNALRIAQEVNDFQLCDAIVAYPLLLELNNARAAYAGGSFSSIEAADLERRLRAVASSLPYEARRGQIYTHLGELLRLCGRYAEATKVLDVYLPQGEAEGLGDIELLIGRSDRAVCLLHLNDVRAALQERGHLHKVLEGQMSDYDRASLLTNLAELEAQLGRPDAAARLSAQAAEAWRVRESRSMQMRDSLNRANLISFLERSPRLSLVLQDR